MTIRYRLGQATAYVLAAPFVVVGLVARAIAVLCLGIVGAIEAAAEQLKGASDGVD